MGKRLGVMGGSFDPIHNGHLGTAFAMEKALTLDEVLFIPAYISPFKQWKEAAPGHERYAMVELAIKDHPTWKASDMELKRTGISYTYDTIVALKKEQEVGTEIFFIIGADSALELTKWYKIKEMLELCTFVVATRPGFLGQIDAAKKELAEAGLTNILWVKTPEIEISSTEVRKKVQQGLSIENFVPKAIVEYIRQRDLYRQ